MKLTLFCLLICFTFILSKCPSGQHYLGGVCKVCSQVRSPFGSYYPFKDFCIHKLPSLDNTTRTSEIPSSTNTCLGEDVLAMFFSYVSYSDDLEMLISKWFSDEDGYPRIKGCGRWLSVNSFHSTKSIYISAHVYFFINRERKQVVLAFRGTNFDFSNHRTWMDWFGNLYVVLKDCPFVNCGKVHYGFKTTYRTHKFELLQQAAEYLNNGYQIIITGHSQGGSVSQIATLHFNDYFKNHASRIKNYSFATPRTGNSDFVNAFERIQNKGIRYSAVDGNSRDLVTAIPPEVMFYKHTPRESIIKCQSKYFGNPNPPKDIVIRGIFPRNVPSILGCHYQQVYLDGLIDMKRKGLTTEMDPNSISNTVRMEDVDTVVDEMLKNK